jgi:hypothetical protein
LHNLDSTRKHRRLLAAFAEPRRMLLTTFTILSPTQAPIKNLDWVSPWPGFKDDTVIASTDADTPDYDIRLFLHVRLVEFGGPPTESVIATLRDFASAAYAIIEIFDY